jgi:glycosyltransferase involved in cell wall biosynthesis
MERLIAGMVQRADTTQFEVHLMAITFLGHFSQGLDAIATLHTASPMSRLSMLRPSALADDIASINPDVVHTHGGVWYKASLAARMAGVPRLVHTDHGRRSPDPLSHRLLDRTASRRTDAIVAVSDRLRTQLQDIVSEPSRLHVIANGVDTTEYTPANDDGVLRGELGIPAEAPVLGSIGRLEPIKGYDVMIQAFAALSREWSGTAPHPFLVLVGDGTERARLERDTASLGIHDHVRFLGWRSDIVSCQRAFTLFTMSSRSEGTSVSLLEAMSAGLCPVVTDVGGNAAVLGDLLRHRLVPSETPGALARAWRNALDHADQRRHDAALARERVVDAFSLDTMVRSYESLYLQR